MINKQLSNARQIQRLSARQATFQRISYRARLQSCCHRILSVPLVGTAEFIFTRVHLHRNLFACFRSPSTPLSLQEWNSQNGILKINCKLVDTERPRFVLRHARERRTRESPNKSEPGRNGLILIWYVICGRAAAVWRAQKRGLAFAPVAQNWERVHRDDVHQ